ncbi:hypothetical protein NAC44_02025 [Allorhizobium sp. BGMRC 0089]|uniref:hypothetical protein n=1 Tax=Allorhizobium sonneratiae TaxID=2934936 RepID=UPI0020335173|nr:hypothetical protein [Allorhizobium sonneratiae]MCM2291105.1 hypothetical protein [Allorhizobium sonneratiae]
MSLTEDIAGLVSRVNTLLNTFETKEAAINAAVAAAVAAAPGASRTVWVDPVNGNDSNSGLSVAAAFMTFERAIEATAHVSVVNINLLGDVTIRKRVGSNAGTISINGRSSNGDRTVPKRKLGFTAMASNAPNIYGETFPGGLELLSRAALRFDNIEIVMPDIPSTTTAFNLFAVYGGLAVTMWAGGIYAENASTKAVLYGLWHTNPVDLWFDGTVIDSTARGHILPGVAASADPNAIKNFRSNVTAL